jgi:hypothetical protein
MNYDDATHTYTDGRVVVPSVTQLLAPPCGFYTPGSAERGKEVHEACVKYARSKTDFNMSPYVDSFCFWYWKHNPKLISAEEMLENNIDGMRYAGRYDMLVNISGQKVLIDIKTGVKAKWHIAQLAAYALVVKPAKCMVLYLRDDMTCVEQWLSSADLVNGIKALRFALGVYYSGEEE